jgi:hypothetical protein
MKKIVIILFIAITTIATAQTPEQLRKSLPEISEWIISDKVEVFSPDNLYDRINGAADAFLSCNFSEMTQMSYNRNNSDTYITIQCYRHASPADAFCIYSTERFPDAEFITIGAEAYREPQVLNMLVGDMYIKIETHDKSDEAGAAMEKIAQAMAKAIDPEPALPAMLKQLPQENKVLRSELYVAQSFMGHKFLHSAYVAQYEDDGKTYNQFIIDAGTREGAEKMIKDYLTFAKQDITPKEKEKITVNDRYNGSVDVTWDGRYIAGRTHE